MVFNKHLVWKTHLHLASRWREPTSLQVLTFPHCFILFLFWNRSVFSTQNDDPIMKVPPLVDTSSLFTRLMEPRHITSLMSMPPLNSTAMRQLKSKGSLTDPLQPQRGEVLGTVRSSNCDFVVLADASNRSPFHRIMSRVLHEHDIRTPTLLSTSTT
jgi:hypothetical protein